jgi:hypothetical protein
MPTSRRTSLLTPLVLLAALAPAACARPLPGRPLDPLAELGAAAPPLPQNGVLGYDELLALAVADSPELQALRHAVVAAQDRPAGEPLGVSAGADSDGRPELGLSLDLLSVLGLGPRRADAALARLRRSEAELALLAKTRETAGALAEELAALSAFVSLGEVACPTCEAEAFVAAGVAPAAAADAARAAASSLDAEARAREAERRTAWLAVQRLTGRRPDPAHDATVRHPDPAWPPVPEPDIARVLAASPDVQRRIGAYEVARGEALRAQSLRDPGIVLDPAVALDPTHFFGAVSLRLPLGAGPAIRAAFARMEAARLEVRASVLVALERAAASRETWQAAEAELVAARARRTAAAALAESERARVQAQGEGFTEAVLAVNSVVDALRAEREAAVQAARARVKAAVAAGWPGSFSPPTPPIPDARGPSETPP